MKPCKCCGEEHDKLKSAMRGEIGVADKQIELIQLRMKEHPETAETLRPFGSAIWGIKRSLEKALAD